MEDQPTLEQKARRYLGLKNQMDALQEEADLIRLEIKTDIQIAGFTEPQVWQGVRVSPIPASVRFRLDKARLVNAGVTAAQLAAGEVKTEIEATVRITGTEDDD